MHKGTGILAWSVNRPWRAGPDSDRLPAAVLRLCFRKHLSPVCRHMGGVIRKRSCFPSAF